MVPNTELPNGNECTTRPRTCCRKLARQPKHGGHKTILERWHNVTNLASRCQKIGWTEEQIIQYDELALEDHSYIATRGERDRNEKSWVLKLNKEGAQGPVNQRPDFVEA